VLAQGLNILTLLLDPGVIVLGGGFSRAGDALLEPLGERMTSGLAWRDRPEVLTSELGDEAGRIGAAILAFRGGRPRRGHRLVVRGIRQRAVSSATAPTGTCAVSTWSARP
jgi:predicted NBD/HSP70 family sugar kinase